jgi:hypothetical protein
MRSRLVSLILSLLLVLLVVLVGILTEFATSDPSRLPPVLGPIRQWSMPLLGVTVLLLAAGTVWQYLVEHRPPTTHTWTSKRPPYPGLEASPSRTRPCSSAVRLRSASWSTACPDPAASGTPVRRGHRPVRGRQVIADPGRPAASPRPKTRKVDSRAAVGAGRSPD